MSFFASLTVAKEPEPRVERTVNWFRWTMPPSESNSSEAWVVERTWEVFLTGGGGGVRDEEGRRRGLGEYWGGQLPL